MPLDQSLFPVLTPAKVEYEAATRPTGFGEYLGAKAQQGFDYSIAGRITERMTSPSPALGPLPAGNTPEQNADMGFKPGRRVTEDEWKKLKLDRPGLAFSGGGTVEYEQARTAAYDERRYRDRIVERYQGGFLGQAAGFAASLVGSVPSPENFVPFVGQATRAAMVARMGRIGGMAAAGALDATIGTAVADSFVLPDLASRGEDVGAADFALDLALGAVVGTAFGAGGGVLARRADARVRREQLAQAARAVRIDGLERQADALEVAMRAVADDQPVDVGPVVADALPKVQERYIRAYHGSPYTFERFDLSKIGTGEGNQSFGYGLYFAENDGVAANYRKNLAEGEVVLELGGKPFDEAQFAERYGVAPELARIFYNELADTARIDRALDSAGQRLATETDPYPASLAQLENAVSRLAADGVALRQPGSLYTVDLRADPEDLLDWDAPLSQQSEKVRKALAKAGIPERRRIDEDEYEELTGQDAYRELQDRATGIRVDDEDILGVNTSPRGQNEASKALRAAGVPGIRYLDGNSRADGEGTRNFVMFDDALVNIREINGKAVAAPDPIHPSIIEAETVRPPPKTGVEEAQRLAADMGLDDPPELADIAVMKRDGLLTAADEASLERANEVVKEADGWAEAYKTLATCSLRFGQ